jgi:RIO-like serine/threonine protein kinase
MLFADNIGSHLSIDEVALSKGERYTIVSNKSGKGKEGALVACITGTKAETIIKFLKKLPIEKRNNRKRNHPRYGTKYGFGGQRILPFSTFSHQLFPCN